jgi:hypothetical protein
VANFFFFFAGASKLNFYFLLYIYIYIYYFFFIKKNQPYNFFLCFKKLGDCMVSTNPSLPSSLGESQGTPHPMDGSQRDRSTSTWVVKESSHLLLPCEGGCKGGSPATLSSTREDGSWGTLPSSQLLQQDVGPHKPLRLFNISQRRRWGRAAW